MSEVNYNDEMDAGKQLEAEEHISAIIFDRQETLREGARFSRAACDRLGFDVVCAVLAHFPTEYEVEEEDFSRHTSEVAATIYKRQGRPGGGRVFSEEDCNRLGREILAGLIAHFRPDLIEEAQELTETVEA